MSFFLMTGLVLGYFAVNRLTSRDQNKTEHQIDKTLADSFPASDPPGGY